LRRGTSLEEGTRTARLLAQMERETAAFVHWKVLVGYKSSRQTIEETVWVSWPVAWQAHVYKHHHDSTSKTLNRVSSVRTSLLSVDAGKGLVSILRRRQVSRPSTSRFTTESENPPDADGRLVVSGDGTPRDVTEEQHAGATPIRRSGKDHRATRKSNHCGSYSSRPGRLPPVMRCSHYVAGRPGRDIPQVHIPSSWPTSNISPSSLLRLAHARIDRRSDGYDDSLRAED
jgi:hypothetical protein